MCVYGIMCLYTMSIELFKPIHMFSETLNYRQCVVGTAISFYFMAFDLHACGILIKG